MPVCLLIPTHSKVDWLARGRDPRQECCLLQFVLVGPQSRLTIRSLPTNIHPLLLPIYSLPVYIALVNLWSEFGFELARASWKDNGRLEALEDIHNMAVQGMHAVECLFWLSRFRSQFSFTCSNRHNRLRLTTNTTVQFNSCSKQSVSRGW